MSNPRHIAPAPDLRIVMTDSLFAHEDHDSQRSEPLIERMRTEQWMINPPIVAPMDAHRFVILDGANRAHAFRALGFPHILVQVASYESGQVELSTWQHIVCAWTPEEFTESLRNLPEIHLAEGQDAQAIAHIIFRDRRIYAVKAPVDTTHERNAALRAVVRTYQKQAVLQRTALIEPDEIFPLHPDGIAIVHFPEYQPSDIIAAARHDAFLPAGVSRHIVHGRAVRVNYPIEWLRDPDVSLREKNEALFQWMQEKLSQKRVRFYAESTYQFDE
ncbi:hypothetical protein FBR02_06425 [Anaerolineae bacterium CFX9]|nr:hypothetical protein [Anaerolineae bacterium CFX9]